MDLFLCSQGLADGLTGQNHAAFCGVKLCKDPSSSLPWSLNRDANFPKLSEPPQTGCCATTVFPQRNISAHSPPNMYATRALRMFRPTARMMRPIPVSNSLAPVYSIAPELTRTVIEGGAIRYVKPCIDGNPRRQGRQSYCG
jgi:hypothetical protein